MSQQPDDPSEDEGSEEGRDPAESVYDAVQQSPFSPYEPEAEPKSKQEPLPLDDGADLGGGGEAKGPEEPAQFDPRHTEAFTGLLFLGRLQKTVRLWGHEFVIRTLSTDDAVEVGMFVKEFQGTRGENAVYQSAVLAAAVVTVDGQEIPAQALGPADSHIPVRAQWIMRKWMPPVRERIWEEVFTLESQVREVLDAMGKA